MTRLTATLLFSKNKTKEPLGILKCDSSGEYLPFNFYDWKDAIHYIQWTNNYNKNNYNKNNYNKNNYNKNNYKINNETKLLQEWSNKYGYDYEEKFTGDLNEFRCEKNYPDKWIVFTTFKKIDGSENLNEISAWK